MKAKREVWPREGISEMLVTYLPGWEWERLTLESGPDPVEAIKAKIEELRNEPYARLNHTACKIEGLKFALAAIGEE